MKYFIKYLILKILSVFLPKGTGLIVRPQHKKQWKYNKDELMGGKIKRSVYFPDGIDPKYLGTQESQAITAFDFWTCVANSLCRVLQILLNYLITVDPIIKMKLDELGFIDENGKVNISQRALAVMSGTVPGRGNSCYRVAETARKRGLTSEKFCPTLPGMTELQFFTLPKGTDEQAKKFLEIFDIYHEDPDIITPDLFTYGGLQACVDTSYRYSGGVIQPPLYYNYSHAVCNYNKNTVFEICDSYPEYLKKFALTYKLGFPKIIHLVKKKRNLLVKESGSPAVYFYAGCLDQYFPIRDYSNENFPIIAGGDILKTFCGNYKNAGIKRLDANSIPREKISGRAGLSD